MAQQNNTAALAVLPSNPFTYKGHPHPSIDERLKQCRNFLADEDVNRCLDFTSNLAEIEEFLAHIEKEKLQRNKYLFGDVKAMVDVQNEWMKWMDKPPADHHGPEDVSHQPNYSTRLIDAENAAKFELQRKAFGVDTQMREDHPPFTIERSGDQAEFLKKMRRDAAVDPEELDLATNLHYVEHRAYDWARREPSLIPYWMHWSKGLPQKGVKPGDAQPWYRENFRMGSAARVPRAPAPRPHNIFLREVLPDYLQRREDDINRLLKAHQSKTVSSKLADLLNLHAPRNIKELSEERDYFSSIEDILSSEERLALTTTTSSLDKKLQEWVETIRPSGIQVRLSHDNWTDPHTPGVFYVADGQPTARDHADLEAREARINKLLATGSLSARKYEQLKKELEDFIPLEIQRCDARIQAILIRSGKKTPKSFKKLSPTLRKEFNRKQEKSLSNGVRQSYTNVITKRASMLGSWIGMLHASVPVSLRFLRPGESASTAPGQLLLPWSPESEPPLQLPPPEIRQHQSAINDCLYAIDNDGKNKVTRAQLNSLLEPVILPHLRDMKPGGDGAASENSGKDYHIVLKLWKNCLILRKVEILMPQNGTSVDFNPGVLYYRGVDAAEGNLPEATDLDQWATTINSTRSPYKTSDISKDADLNAMELQMYNLLEHLQYPALRRLDIAWTTLARDPYADQKTATDFKTAWMLAFRAWLPMILYHHGAIVVKKADKNDETLGDPGVVYYRGSIKEVEAQSVDQTALPSDIQAQVSQINELMREYNKKKTPETEENLKSSLSPFWRAVREHEDRQELTKDSGLTFDEIEEVRGREREFAKRFLLFMELSAGAGCTVKKHQADIYEVEDPTSKLPEQWRIKKDDEVKGHNPLYLKKLLKHLWIYPQRFYRALRDAEIEINDSLRGLSEIRQPADEENARLLQLMRPFLPRAIAGLAVQLENKLPRQSLMYGAFQPQHDPTHKSFVALYAQWLRELQRYSRDKWLKIHVWDSADLASKSFVGLEGRLYFSKPLTTNNGKIRFGSDTSSDSLATRFRRYETEINYLLKRRRVPPPSPDQTSLSWKENDRLRQLLHLVMNPVVAKADDELREIDELSRSDILQGEELTSYLSKLEAWQAKYNKWIDAFPDEGIELHPLDKDTPRDNDGSGVRFVYVGNDQLLPPAFRSNRIPLHVQRMTRDFNAALRARNLTNLEQKAVFAQYTPLIKATYREDINALREIFFRQHFPDDVNPNNKVPPNSEIIAILKCVENLALKTVWERLRQLARRGRRTGTSIEIYEQLRGELRIRLKSADSPAPSDDESGTANVAMPISKVSDILIPGLSDARAEFVPLAEKLRHGHNLTDEERGKIVQHFQLSENDHPTEIEDAIVLILKVFDGKPLTDVEQAHAKKLMLRFLWRNFANVSPEVVERACPELRPVIPVEALLDPVSAPGAIHTAPPLSPAPTEAEVREVGIELNNLLQKFRDATISDQEDRVLDYLLRPLGNPRLRELDRQIENLALISRSADANTIPPYIDSGLNPRQSVHLVELQTQWAREFENWKANIPRYGVIFDEWYSEPDVIPSVMRRYRAVREALSHPQVHDPRTQNPLEIFLTLKRYITDSTFSDIEGKLFLERLPDDIVGLRDVLFRSRRDLEARNRRLSLSESLSLNLLEHVFVTRYMAWYNAVPLREKMLSQLATISDFSGKAERRGVQRAAIELALNLLATNEEQHRPLDRFRKVILPPSYRPPQKELRMYSDLEPWNRPVEQDPFKVTKIMLKYRAWKDHVYSAARERAIDTNPGHLEPPMNYHGPCILSSEQDVWSSLKKRQQQLLRIQAALIHASTVAPRPLIHRLTTLINDALVDQLDEYSNKLVDLDDIEPLDANDLETLSALCAPSWNERSTPYPVSVTGLENDIENLRASLDEFDRDIDLIVKEMPLWEPYNFTPTVSEDPNDPDFYIQLLYDPHVESATGWDLNTLLEVINERRQQRAEDPDTVHLWSRDEGQFYLSHMHQAGRIHIQSTTIPGQEMISRIPPNGHPENKYIMAQGQVEHREYIRLNASSSKKWEVRYDADGTVGQPILQPNLYEHLQNLAFSVGRAIRRLHDKIGDSHATTDRLEDQFDSKQLAECLMYRDTPADKEISLAKIARDLSKVAPDLLEESLVDLENDRRDHGAATIIQMQLIQESNNNWDSRFPEREEVWGFADLRLSPVSVALTEEGKPIRNRVKKYFSQRRWPVWAQSEKKVEVAAKPPGLVMQEKPVSPPLTAQARERIYKAAAKAEGAKGERYTGRGLAPLFPFGETSYQRAYLSFKMEQDLADVEEFKPKPKRRRLFSREPEVKPDPPVNPYELPTIPENWKPDSVSVQQKWADVTERARKVDGFPQDLEYWYSKEESDAIRSHEEYLAAIKQQEQGRALVEGYTKKPYGQLPIAEIQAAQLALGIDPYTGIVTRQPPPAPSRGLPLISRVFGKRNAEGNPEGQEARAAKRARVDNVDNDDFEDDGMESDGGMFEF